MSQPLHPIADNTPFSSISTPPNIFAPTQPPLLLHAPIDPATAPVHVTVLLRPATAPVSIITNRPAVSRQLPPHTLHLPLLRPAPSLPLPLSKALPLPLPPSPRARARTGAAAGTPRPKPAPQPVRAPLACIPPATAAVGAAPAGGPKRSSAKPPKRSPAVLPAPPPSPPLAAGAGLVGGAAKSPKISVAAHATSVMRQLHVPPRATNANKTCTPHRFSALPPWSSPSECC